MKLSSVLFAVVVLVLVISLVAIWFYPSVQDFMASNTMWNGIKNFASEFNADNIDSLDNLPTLPEKTTLVVIPYLKPDNEELTKMKRFINNGGTLLLMDDYGFGNTVLAYLGVDIRFTNKPLLDPIFFNKHPQLPRITDFAPKVTASGIDAIMLNHATTLTNVPESAAIAWSSDYSFLDIDENGSLGQDETKGPFTVAAELRLGKGTLALASDPSIMINSMVGRDDNRQFISYLISRQGEQKKILIDRSHLIPGKAPLDISRIKLSDTTKILSSPYALVGILAMIFVVVSRHTLKKGGTIG